jgi:hypothetical protein
MRKHRPPTQAQMRAACDLFNRTHSVGDTLRVWSGLREGEPTERTIAEPGAYVLGGHTAVVQVKGGGGCVNLTHVEWDHWEMLNG